MNSTRPLKRYCLSTGQYGVNVASERYQTDGVRLIRTSDVTEDGILHSADDAVFIDEDDAEGLFLAPGDLLFSRSGTLGRALLYPGSATPATFAGYLVRFRARRDVDPRFLYYVSRSSTFLQQIEADAIHSTIGNFNAEKYGNLRVPEFDRDEQSGIADFLDAETARIDGLIEKKHRLLRLMSLRRSSAIGEALESAGGEFLSLRRVVAAFIDYRGATPEKAPSGVPLITATNVSDGEIDLSLGEQFVSEETYIEWMRRGFPDAGDVLLTTEAPLGEVAMISNPRVALAQRIILLKPDRRRVLPEFLYASLRSPVVQADLLSRASGSTVWGIRADRLRDVGVHINSLLEQRRVVAVMRRFEDEYRRARELLERQIDLLREHRQALITAAVAGQVEVAKAAA